MFYILSNISVLSIVVGYARYELRKDSKIERDVSIRLWKVISVGLILAWIIAMLTDPLNPFL